MLTPNLPPNITPTPQNIMRAPLSTIAKAADQVGDGDHESGAHHAHLAHAHHKQAEHHANEASKAHIELHHAHADEE